MKKLAAKLTALLLVCLLLPLTACSPVDFSEQIQDVYSYWDFEVIVRTAAVLPGKRDRRERAAGY